MQTTNEKIALLRAAMKAAGANACLIPSSDPHISEYLPAHWSARRYFSGFTGSVGNLVVTETASALWVDGRYFVQAAISWRAVRSCCRKWAWKACPP